MEHTDPLSVPGLREGEEEEEEEEVKIDEGSRPSGDCLLPLSDRRCGTYVCVCVSPVSTSG